MLRIVSWALCVAFIGGGTAQPLAYERAESDIDLDARHSSDGSLIAFRRGTNPYSDLYVMSAAGGKVRRVTRLASRIRGFDWMPDGRSLVFSSGHGGPQALYVVSLDDGHVEALGVQPAENPSSARSHTACRCRRRPRCRCLQWRAPLRLDPAG